MFLCCRRVYLRLCLFTDFLHKLEHLRVGRIAERLHDGVDLVEGQFEVHLSSHLCFERGDFGGELFDSRRKNRNNLVVVYRKRNAFGRHKPIGVDFLFEIFVGILPDKVREPGFDNVLGDKPKFIPATRRVFPPVMDRLNVLDELESIGRGYLRDDVLQAAIGAGIEFRRRYTVRGLDRDVDGLPTSISS